MKKPQKHLISVNNIHPYKVEVYYADEMNDYLIEDERKLHQIAIKTKKELLQAYQNGFNDGCFTMKNALKREARVSKSNVKIEAGGK